MIIVVCEFVQEWPGLQYEGGQHHFGQVHTWTHLLQIDKRIGDLFRVQGIQRT